MTKPNPVLVTALWIRSLASVNDIIDSQVSYRLNGSFPAIRLTDVGPADRGPAEGLYTVQIECWAEDYDTAQSLAGLIDQGVEDCTARGQWGDVWCSGGEVSSGPFASPDPQSERYCHQLDVRLWLYPA